MWLLLVTFSIFLILWILKKVHFDHKDCSLPQRLDHKRVIVTGCNQGIGLETVGELARRGAYVIMACRDINRCRAARQQLLDRFGSKANLSKLPSAGLNLTPIEEEQLICESLDLSSVTSICKFADRMIQQNLPVDILINNAGHDLMKPRFGPDGIEEHLRVNHLGHFLLTNLLRPLLELSDAGRVVVVASLMHRLAELNLQDLNRPLVGSCYSNSKLLNVIFARELSRRWGKAPSDSGIVAVSVHPGFVRTEIFHHSRAIYWFVHRCLWWLTKTPWQGSQTVVYCALADDLVPGAYYSECRVSKVNPQATDPKVGEAVWQASEQLIEVWKTKIH